MGSYNASGSLGFLLGPLFFGAIVQFSASSWGWPSAYRMAFVSAGLCELLCVALMAPLLFRLIRDGRVR